MIIGLRLRSLFPRLDETLPLLYPGERPLGFRRLPALGRAEEDEELLDELEVDAIGGERQEPTGEERTLGTLST